MDLLPEASASALSISHHPTHSAAHRALVDPEDLLHLVSLLPLRKTKQQNLQKRRITAGRPPFPPMMGPPGAPPFPPPLGMGPPGMGPPGMGPPGMGPPGGFPPGPGTFQFSFLSSLSLLSLFR